MLPAVPSIADVRRAIVNNPVPAAGAVVAAVMVYACNRVMAADEPQKPPYRPVRDPTPADPIAAVPGYPTVRHDPATAVVDRDPFSQITKPTEPNETVRGIPRDVIEGQAVEDAMKAGGDRAAQEVMTEIVMAAPTRESAERKAHQLAQVAARTKVRGGRNARIESGSVRMLRDRMSGSLMRNLDARKSVAELRDSSSSQMIRRDAATRRNAMAAGFAKPPPPQRMSMRPLEYGMPTQHPLDVARAIGEGQAVPAVRQAPNNTLSMNRPGASSLTDMQQSEGFSWAQRERTEVAARGAGMMKKRSRSDRQSSFCDRIRPKPCGCGGRCSHRRSMAVPHGMSSVGSNARVSRLP